MTAKPKPEPYAFEPIKNYHKPESTCTEADSEDEDSEKEPLPEKKADSKLNNMNWCICGKCVVLPGMKEHHCVCCGHIFALNMLRNGLQCVTDNPQFQTVCLNREVLDVALLSAASFLKEKPLIRPLESRQYRLAAYRQFTIWSRGYLGKKQRKLIPPCVVNLIHKTYPPAGNFVVGFIEGTGDFL